MRPIAILVMALTAAAPRSEACGQQTHTWISLEAYRQLPDGPLKALLGSEEGQRYLVNGSMFPDGGYAINHPYGEAAHWAPFHVGMLDWIRDRYDDPLNDPDAVVPVAFLFGVIAHGLADELYDATFFAASRVHDAVEGEPDHHYNFDAATDILFAAHSGHRIEPDAALPMNAVLEVYEGLNIEIGADQIDRGQNLLRTAAWFVATAADSGADVADAAEQYPWAAAHMGDTGVSGAPPVIAEAVLAYWLAMEERLRGNPDQPLHVVHQWPRTGEVLAGLEAGQPEARLAWMLSRAIDDAGQLRDLGTELLHEDQEIEHSSRLFYGDHSHVIVADPAEAWPVAERIHYRLPAGLETYDGTESPETLRGEFRTKPLPPPEPPAAEGCSCSSAPLAVWLLALPLALRRRR